MNKKTIKIAAAVIVTILIVGISYFRLFELFELATLDLRFKARPVQKVSDDIVIIEIAGDTLNQLASWPIDRKYHAVLIDILTAFNARHIIFDVVFCEEQAPASDKVLAESAATSGEVYVAEVYMLLLQKGGIPLATEVLLSSFPELKRVVKGIGHINILNDIDGKSRRLPLLVRYKEGLRPYISFLAVCDYFNISPDDLEIVPGHCIKFNEDIEIPIDGDGTTIINFAGKWEEVFRHYSFVDILKSYVQMQKGEPPRVDLNELRDKICIIGLTAPGTHDINPVPLETDYPMVGVHANFINMVLTNSFIVRADRWMNVVILILLAMAAVLCVLKPRPAQSLMIIAGLMVCFTIVAFLLFIILRIWIDLLYPLVLICAIYLSATLFRYMSERRRRILIEKELNIAKRIQKSFLKQKAPETEGLDIAVLIDPAKAVGGDLYDFIKISETKIGIMIGDVSGKGMPAALFMAKTVSDFRFHSKMEKNPSRAITQLNDQVSSESTSGLFVTVCYIVIDVKDRSINIVDAGHLPVIAAHKDAPAELLEVKGGMAIGIMDGIEFPENVIKPFKQGDVFLLYTDGVTEARNSKRKEFGEGEIIKALEESKGTTAQKIVDTILRRIRRFQGKARQHDDITLVAVKIL